MEGKPSSEIALEEAKVFSEWDSTLVNVLKLKVGKNKAEEIEKRVEASRDSVKKEVAALQKEESEKQVDKRDVKDYDVLFRVQITSSSKKIPLNSRKFKDVSDVFEYQVGDVFKYAVGNCVTQEDAIELQNKVRQTEFNDAFVVAFYKGERVSVKKAKELIAEGKQ